MQSIQNESGSSSSIFSLIRANYEAMTNKRRKIADYILEHPDETLQSTISTLAQLTGVKSEASIVRFYKMIGFDSYQDFKLQLAQDLSGNTFSHSVEDIHLDDSVQDIRQKTIFNSIASLSSCLEQQKDQDYEQAVRLVCNASRLILLGYGASAPICNYAHFRFLELGLNCHYSPDSHINAALLSQPNQGDVILCVSVSGKTYDIVRQLNKLPAYKVPVISLTATENSTIAKLSDVVFLTKARETSLLSDAMYARLIQMATIDTLYLILSIHMGSNAFLHLYQTREIFRDFRDNEKKEDTNAHLFPAE